jgi:hypothetical protein
MGSLSKLYSPIAQLVEQVAVNHLVVGSNPARGAILNPKGSRMNISHLKHCSSL